MSQMIWIIGALITCIFNLNYYHIKLILMLILCNYDACCHSFMKFSPLTCHFTNVILCNYDACCHSFMHIFSLFRVNYVLY